MAAKDTTTTTDTAAPSGLRLPLQEAFATIVPVVDEGPNPGTVIGLDLSVWAFALVDLTDKPDRIAAAQYRLERKGYRSAGSDALVVGYRRAEVWVMPRQMFIGRQQAKRAKLFEMVQNERIADSAITRPVVRMTNKRGIATPVD